MSSRLLGPASELDLLKTKKFVGFKSCFLQNNDKCQVGDWVLLRSVTPSRSFSLGKVEEILQICGSSAELGRRPDFILLSMFSVAGTAEKYLMPRLVKTNASALVDYKVKISLSCMHLLVN